MILLVGSTAVGKTLLLKRLQSTNSPSLKDDVPSTIPTVGTNLMTVITSKKTEVIVREMGGAMEPIWHNYYKDCHAIMFMIDVSRLTQVAISCVQLMTMLSNLATQNSAVMILLNKTDVSNRVEVQALLRLDQVMKHATQNISVLEISAKTGHNLDKVTKWLHQQSKQMESRAKQTDGEQPHLTKSLQRNV